MALNCARTITASTLGLASGAADTLPPFTIGTVESRLGKFVELAAVLAGLALQHREPDPAAALVNGGVALLTRRMAYFHGHCAPNGVTTARPMAAACACGCGGTGDCGGAPKAAGMIAPIVESDRYQFI